MTAGSEKYLILNPKPTSVEVGFMFMVTRTRIYELAVRADDAVFELLRMRTFRNALRFANSISS